MVTGGMIFSSKCTKKRLAAGLCPDPLGECLVLSECAKILFRLRHCLFSAALNLSSLSVG